MKLHLGVIALLLSADIAFAQEPVVSDQAAQQEKRVCRTQKMTGSLTRVRRTCMTLAQWNRLQEGNQRNAQELQRDADERTRIETLGTVVNPVPAVSCMAVNAYC